MPYSRPSLSDLRALVAQEISASLPGTDPLLRFSVLGILGRVLAGMSNLHYGYIDWIAQQSNPYTATDEYLEMWAALRKVYRKPPTSASGSVTFPANTSAVVPAGTIITRSDGVACTTTADATAVASAVTVLAAVNADPAGLAGAFGDCSAGTAFTLGAPISGVQSGGVAATAFIGGADLELDSSLRSRMLLAYQWTPQGGAAQDYEAWALAVPGVTRAWVTPSGMGPGTVTVRFMMDSSEVAHNGFPQGTDGVSQNDNGGAPRAAVATGDQLTVADAIVAAGQPVTALVYSVAPTSNPINFAITGLSGSSALLQAQISAAIAGVFMLYGSPGGTVDLSYVNAAIDALPGTAGFVIAAPTANIASPVGALPTVGTITYA